MQKFKSIYQQAVKRKGGEEELKKLLTQPLTKEQLIAKGDDRYLAAMTQAINQAGFNWSVIAKKWPEFEEAFYGFNIMKLSYLSLDDWSQYMSDRRIVRHGQKIRSVMENVNFIEREAKKHGSFAKFIAAWPESDQIGLLAYLKKHGSRLGGQTGQWFLRYVGKDCFIITKDVVFAIRSSGVDIDSQPTAKRDLNKIQQVFNKWHEETGLCYTHLSRIAAFSVGINHTTGVIQQEVKKISVL